MGIASYRVLSGLLQIDDRPEIVTALFKMHRQLCRYVPGMGPIGLLQALADALVQTDTSRCRNLVVDHILIQGVNELVASRDGPIGPGDGPGWPQKLLPLG